jgi:hypothetical protein
MKRTVLFLSFVLIFATSAFARTAQTQQPEKLSKAQLNALIATAKTPAEHSRIAEYYRAEAQYDLAQSQEHAQMAEHYKQSSVGSSAKFTTGTVNHCEYLARNFKANAVKMEALSQEHAQMAKEAEQK